MYHLATIAFVLMFASNAALAQQTEAPNEAILGIWSNPSGSVHVQIEDCGVKLCGVIVYASESAKADAARAGTDELIGLNLFRDFDQYDPGRWRGKVLVPDLNRTVSGELKPIGADVLRVHGCMFGHVACKNQNWARVSK